MTYITNQKVSRMLVHHQFFQELAQDGLRLKWTVEKGQWIKFYCTKREFDIDLKVLNKPLVLWQLQKTQTRGVGSSWTDTKQTMHGSVQVLTSQPMIYNFTEY